MTEDVALIVVIGVVLAIALFAIRLAIVLRKDDRVTWYIIDKDDESSKT